MPEIDRSIFTGRPAGPTTPPAPKVDVPGFRVISIDLGIGDWLIVLFKLSIAAIPFLLVGSCAAYVLTQPMPR